MHMYFNENCVLSYNSQIRNVHSLRGLNDGCNKNGANSPVVTFYVNV